MSLAIVRRRQPHEIENGQPFADVLPVHLRRELAHVHSLAAHGHVFRAQRAVLLEVSFVDGAIQLEDAIRTAERVHQRPVVHVLDGIVGSVVRTPAREAQQVIALVEVLRMEGFAGLGVRAEQFALEQRPFGRWHGRADVATRSARRRRMSAGRVRWRPWPPRMSRRLSTFLWSLFKIPPSRPRGS